MQRPSGRRLARLGHQTREHRHRNGHRAHKEHRRENVADQQSVTHARDVTDLAMVATVGTDDEGPVLRGD